MGKAYSILSAGLAGFWSGLVTFGLRGGWIMFGAIFVVFFLMCILAFSLCFTAGHCNDD